MDYEQLARKIIEDVGGEENIKGLTSCATRLRFQLYEESKADSEKLESNPNILQAFSKSGQYQVIIGTEVSKVYEKIENIINVSSKTDNEANNQPTGNIISRLFDVISGIFTPLLPPLAGSGILRGLLLLFVQLGWMNEDSGTYGILSAASMAVFYFLPVLLAFTAARRFNANPYIAAIIGASLIHPDFIDLLGEQGTGASTDFLGIPVVLMEYSSTVIPALLAIWAYSYLERILERYVWNSLQIILVPLISLVIIVPLTVLVFGPFGVYTGEGIASGIEWLSETNGWLTGLIVGGIWNVFVVFGLQWAVNPIMISNIGTLGYDKIVPLTGAANFGMAGATLGVILKTKNTQIRSFSWSALLSIFFAGITEPAIYGVAIRFKRPLIAAIIGGAAGGAYIGGTGTVSYAFVFGGLTTLPAFVGSTFIHYVIGLSICFIVGAIAAIILGFEDPANAEETTQLETSVEKNNETITKEQILASPLTGEVMDLKELNDGVFSEQALGEGVAIRPSDGKVYAPAQGAMTTVFPTKHAFGMTTNDETEILIHIGLETVELNGENFTSYVEQNQLVEAGDLIAEFDLQEVQRKNYKIDTPIIITNSSLFSNIKTMKYGKINNGDELLKLSKRVN